MVIQMQRARHLHTHTDRLPSHRQLEIVPVIFIIIFITQFFIIILVDKGNRIDNNGR